MKRRPHILAGTALGCALLTCLTAASPGFAASPSLSAISPRGGQRGTEVELVLGGARLGDAQELMIYQPGIAVSKLEIVNDQQVKAKVQIAAEATLGEYVVRLRTLTGVSELRTFYVGPFPVVAEAEPNSDFSQPQKIASNLTVHGVVENEDVDYYLVEAKAGQRISAEIEGIRLGMTLFDPYVSIMDMGRFDLAASDDSALLLQDPVASIVAPKDGGYVVQVRESAYGGNGTCAYRLHVGNFPRPRTAYPAGGKAGEDVNFQLLGDVAGVINQSLRLPAEPSDAFRVFPEQGGLIAPSPVYLRVKPFPNVLEAEPNHDAVDATRAPGELPVALNGVISADGDIDWFRFVAKAGQALDVNVYARRVRSPLDPLLIIADAKGAGVASNDDSGGPDSYLRFTAPADGEYTLAVQDHLGRGSPDSTYRVEITPVESKLTIGLPFYDTNNTSQERATIVVPKGNRYATMVRATRADFGGEVTLVADGLPEGVTMTAENVQPNLDTVAVLFEAAPGAPVAGKMVDLLGKAVDPNVKLAKVAFAQAANLVPDGNNAPLYQAYVNKAVVAVVEEAPFKLNVVQPKVPLVQLGAMELKVTAERKPGFANAINVKMLFDPPGVGSGQVQIPGDKNEITIPLNASGDAQIRKWKIAVIGSAEVPNPPAPAEGAPAPAPGTVPVGGVVWVSSQLADLDIAPSFVLGKIELAATEQGKPAPLLCKLEQKVKFDGKATLKLLGLPQQATAPDLEISATDDKAVFNITTDPKTPVGQHNTLVCQMILIKDGEPIVQSFAQGGVLRVDAPPPPKPDAPPPPPAPAPAAAAPAAAPEKVLTRLEKLRLEQAQKK